MTTSYKPYAAFGTAFVKCNATAGEVREVKLGEDGLVMSGYYFYTDGEVSCSVKETGEQIENRTAGWLNLDHVGAGASTSGTLVVTPVVDTEWFCIGRDVNLMRPLPKLTTVILEINESRVLPNNTDLFLARGRLEINGKFFTGPCQVRVRSGDVTVRNDGQNKVYSLIVQAQ